MGLEKHVMTYNHHYSIIQNSFTALKIPCTLSIYSWLSPPSSLEITDILPYPYLCLFYNAIYLKLYNMYNFQFGFLHSVICIFFLHVFSLCDSSFLFSAEYYSIVWIYHSLSIDLNKGILAYFQVLAFMNKGTINIRV